jgi:hypothetical protein
MVEFLEIHRFSGINRCDTRLKSERIPSVLPGSETTIEGFDAAY